MRKLIVALILLWSAQATLAQMSGFRRSAASGSLVQADSSTNVIQTKAEVVNQVNFLRPIQFAVDSASTLAGDTTWVFQNLTGVTLTVDSIHVAASSDDYAISIVKCRYKGGDGTLVDTITASNNGETPRFFFKTETTISSATIPNGYHLGFKKPASTGDAVYVRVHYH